MTATYSQDIAEIVHEVWGTLFDFPLTELRDVSTQADCGVTALVQLEGLWQGAVILQCSTVLAEKLTEALFDTGVSPTVDDIRDALGELVNMVAGNVKVILSRPAHLGLPVVAFGNDYEVRIVGAFPVAQVCFSTQFGLLLVTLAQRANQEGPQT